jgi:hypothetical protein
MLIMANDSAAIELFVEIPPSKTLSAGNRSVRIGVAAQGGYTSPVEPMMAQLQLAPCETSVELRVYLDHFIGEAYFQHGREVITFDAPPTEGVHLIAHGDGAVVTVENAVAWAMGSIYATPEEVLAAPRMDRRADVTH